MRSWRRQVNKLGIIDFYNAISCFLRIQYFKKFGRFISVDENDIRTIPIIIISFNQLTYLKKLINFLQRADCINIIIIDNASTYKPLLRYFEEIKDQVTIHKMKYNYGHMVFWKSEELFGLYGKGYYVVTDADIVPDDECPMDFLECFKNILDRDSSLTKVGFSLRIDNIPKSNLNKEKVLEWEDQFWKIKDVNNNYVADIDTTFALYKPNNMNQINSNFYKAIRTSYPYTAIHGGWYIDTKKLTPEQKYYMQTANHSSSWKLNEDGEIDNPLYN
jgi:hypothetical protein